MKDLFANYNIDTEGYPKEMTVWDNVNNMSDQKYLVIGRIEGVLYKYITVSSAGQVSSFKYAKDIEEK